MKVLVKLTGIILLAVSMGCGISQQSSLLDRPASEEIVEDWELELSNNRDVWKEEERDHNFHERFNIWYYSTWAQIAQTEIGEILNDITSVYWINWSDDLAEMMDDNILFMTAGGLVTLSYPVKALNAFFRALDPSNFHGEVAALEARSGNLGQTVASSAGRAASTVTANNGAQQMGRMTFKAIQDEATDRAARSTQQLTAFKQVLNGLPDNQMIEVNLVSRQLTDTGAREVQRTFMDTVGNLKDSINQVNRDAPAGHLDIFRKADMTIDMEMQPKNVVLTDMNAATPAARQAIAAGAGEVVEEGAEQLAKKGVWKVKALKAFVGVQFVAAFAKATGILNQAIYENSQTTQDLTHLINAPLQSHMNEIFHRNYDVRGDRKKLKRGSKSTIRKFDVRRGGSSSSRSSSSSETNF